MRKQFNLQDWLKDKSQKVETRDGRLVHNIWRVKEPFYTNNRKAEVCALIDGEEDALVFFEGGRYLPTAKDTDNPFDLFIVTPEEEMTGFEEGLYAFLFDFVHTTIEEDPIEYTKKNSGVLLSLARQQLQPEIDAAIEKAYKNADEVMYRKGKEDGIAEGNGISACILALKQAENRAEEAMKGLAGWEYKEAAIKTGDRVLIHCKSTRDAIVKNIYDNQEGEVLHVWDLKRNPWGNIHVRIEGGYNNDFLLEELTKLPGFKEDEK